MLKFRLNQKMVEITVLEVESYLRDLSNDEQNKLDKLIFERKLEIFNLIPRLTCCENIQKNPLIYFTLDFSNYDKARTTLKLNYRWSYGFHNKNENICNKDYAIAKFCPFCGTHFPHVKKKKEFSQYLSVRKFGHDRCLTCKRPFCMCLCDPIESIYEIDV